VSITENCTERLRVKDESFGLRRFSARSLSQTPRCGECINKALRIPLCYQVYCHIRPSLLTPDLQTPAMSSNTVRVAVTQAEPAWLDLAAGVTKTCELIAEAAQNKAKLIAFPECWIPGYPCWIWYVHYKCILWNCAKEDSTGAACLTLKGTWHTLRIRSGSTRPR